MIIDNITKKYSSNKDFNFNIQDLTFEIDNYKIIFSYLSIINPESDEYIN